MTDPTQCPAGNSVTQMELCCGNYTTMNHFTQKQLFNRQVTEVKEYYQLQLRTLWGKLTKHTVKCMIQDAVVLS